MSTLTIEQLTIFVPAFSILLVIIITSINLYYSIRKKFPIKVNCWFCNCDSKVPYEQLNCWNCTKCEQYNGFSEDGDYNCDIPAQRSYRSNGYNSISSPRYTYCDRSASLLANHTTKRVINNNNARMFMNSPPSSSASASAYNQRNGNYMKSFNNTHKTTNGLITTSPLKTTNGFCELCNRNQEMKIHRLQTFEPEYEDNYEEELEEFTKKLEKQYCLCSQCERVLKRALNKVKNNILGSKLSEIGAKGLRVLDELRNKTLWNGGGGGGGGGHHHRNINNDTKSKNFPTNKKRITKFASIVSVILAVVNLYNNQLCELTKSTIKQLIGNDIIITIILNGISGFGELIATIKTFICDYLVNSFVKLNQFLNEFFNAFFNNNNGSSDIDSVNENVFNENLNNVNNVEENSVSNTALFDKTICVLKNLQDILLIDPVVRHSSPVIPKLNILNSIDSETVINLITNDGVGDAGNSKNIFLDNDFLINLFGILLSLTILLLNRGGKPIGFILLILLWNCKMILPIIQSTFEMNPFILDLIKITTILLILIASISNRFTINEIYSSKNENKTKTQNNFHRIPSDTDISEDSDNDNDDDDGGYLIDDNIDVRSSVSGQIINNNTRRARGINANSFIKSHNTNNNNYSTLDRTKSVSPSMYSATGDFYVNDQSTKVNQSFRNDFNPSLIYDINGKKSPASYNNLNNDLYGSSSRGGQSSFYSIQPNNYYHRSVNPNNSQFENVLLVNTKSDIGGHHQYQYDPTMSYANKSATINQSALHTPFLNHNCDTVENGINNLNINDQKNYLDFEKSQRLSTSSPSLLSMAASAASSGGLRQRSNVLITPSRLQHNINDSMRLQSSSLSPSPPPSPPPPPLISMPQPIPRPSTSFFCNNTSPPSIINNNTSQSSTIKSKISPLKTSWVAGGFWNNLTSPNKQKQYIINSMVQSNSNPIIDHNIYSNNNNCESSYPILTNRRTPSNSSSGFESQSSASVINNNNNNNNNNNEHNLICGNLDYNRPQSSLLSSSYDVYLNENSLLNHNRNYNNLNQQQHPHSIINHLHNFERPCNNNNNNNNLHINDSFESTILSQSTIIENDNHSINNNINGQKLNKSSAASVISSSTATAPSYHQFGIYQNVPPPPPPPPSTLSPSSAPPPPPHPQNQQHLSNQFLNNSYLNNDYLNGSNINNTNNNNNNNIIKNFNQLTKNNLPAIKRGSLLQNWQNSTIN